MLNKTDQQLQTDVCITSLYYTNHHISVYVNKCTLTGRGVNMVQTSTEHFWEILDPGARQHSPQPSSEHQQGLSPGRIVIMLAFTTLETCKNLCQESLKLFLLVVAKHLTPNVVFPLICHYVFSIFVQESDYN